MHKKLLAATMMKPQAIVGRLPKRYMPQIQTKIAGTSTRPPVGKVTTVNELDENDVVSYPSNKQMRKMKCPTEKDVDEDAAGQRVGVQSEPVVQQAVAEPANKQHSQYCRTAGETSTCT